MEEADAATAAEILKGSLKANPFTQGLLVQCLRSLDKEARGKDGRGRWKETANDTQRQLVRDSAMTLAMCRSNPALCKIRGNRYAPPVSGWKT